MTFATTLLIYPDEIALVIDSLQPSDLLHIQSSEVITAKDCDIFVNFTRASFLPRIHCKCPTHSTAHSSL